MGCRATPAVERPMASPKRSRSSPRRAPPSSSSCRSFFICPIRSYRQQCRCDGIETATSIETRGTDMIRLTRTNALLTLLLLLLHGCATEGELQPIGVSENELYVHDGKLWPHPFSIPVCVATANRATET